MAMSSRNHMLTHHTLPTLQLMLLWVVLTLLAAVAVAMLVGVRLGRVPLLHTPLLLLLVLLGLQMQAAWALQAASTHLVPGQPALVVSLAAAAAAAWAHGRAVHCRLQHITLAMAASATLTTCSTATAAAAATFMTCSTATAAASATLTACSTATAAASATITA